ncbi:IS21 family transposase [Streptomyces hygroscopicus]|nr:IS21 family transposase [Streptomyces hygroscopicus]
MPAAGHGISPSPPPMRPVPADQLEVEQRPLETYDRIFGVIDGGLTTGEGVA